MQQVNSLSARSLQFYVIAKKWEQDLEFFKFELAFLRKLVSDMFVKGAEQSTPKFRELREGVLKLEYENGEAFVMLENQSTQLELVAEDIIPEDVDALAEKQIALEHLIAALTANFRALKKEIYEIVSTTMAKDKISYN